MSVLPDGTYSMDENVKLQHYRERFAQTVVAYEDALANNAVTIMRLQQRIESLNAELKEARADEAKANDVE